MDPAIRSNASVGAAAAQSICEVAFDDLVSHAARVDSG
jgi:hypothetical protein